MRRAVWTTVLLLSACDCGGGNGLDGGMGGGGSASAGGGSSAGGGTSATGGGSSAAGGGTSAAGGGTSAAGGGTSAAGGGTSAAGGGTSAAGGGTSATGGGTSAAGGGSGALPSNVESLSVNAGEHACALNPSHTAYCWGHSLYGEVGDNSGSANTPHPSPVNGNRTWSQISAGWRMTCGISNQATFCWGGNSFYQLGDGTNMDRPTPAFVDAGVGVVFTQVSAGFRHACALDSAGNPYCWGDNFAGQLGLGFKSFNSTPVPAALDAGAGVSYATIIANEDRTCALDTNKNAWCWGEENQGRLGLGIMGAQLSTPQQVHGSHQFKALALGFEHTCGLDQGNETWCWGSNQNGELGDGTPTSRSVPTWVDGGSGLVALAAGGNHTCGLNASGQMLCWGQLAQGLQGDGGYGDKTFSPTAVAPGYTFDSLQLGDGFTCGVKGMNVTCWGYNSNGELGAGTQTPYEPLPVPLVPLP